MTVAADGIDKLSRGDTSRRKSGIDCSPGVVCPRAAGAGAPPSARQIGKTGATTRLPKRDRAGNLVRLTYYRPLKTPVTVRSSCLNLTSRYRPWCSCARGERIPRTSRRGVQNLHADACSRVKVEKSRNAVCVEELNSSACRVRLTRSPGSFESSTSRSHFSSGTAAKVVVADHHIGRDTATDSKPNPADRVRGRESHRREIARDWLAQKQCRAIHNAVVVRPRYPELPDMSSDLMPVHRKAGRLPAQAKHLGAGVSGKRKRRNSTSAGRPDKLGGQS